MLANKMPCRPGHRLHLPKRKRGLVHPRRRAQPSTNRHSLRTRRSPLLPQRVRALRNGKLRLRRRLFHPHHPHLGRTRHPSQLGCRLRSRQPRRARRTKLRPRPRSGANWLRPQRKRPPLRRSVHPPPRHRAKPPPLSPRRRGSFRGASGPHPVRRPLPSRRHPPRRASPSRPLRPRWPRRRRSGTNRVLRQAVWPRRAPQHRLPTASRRHWPVRSRA